MAFVHLNNRSQYSLLDGAMAPKRLASLASASNMSAVALVDTCNLYGAYEFYTACKGAEVQAVVGSNLWIWPEGLDSLQQGLKDGGWSINLLIEAGPNARSLPAREDDYLAYRNLSALITSAIFDGMHFRPRTDYEKLAQHQEGLVAMVGGLQSPLGAAIRSGRPEDARIAIEQLRSIFGEDHIFIELQDYGLTHQAEVNQLGRELAAEFSIPTIVTNDCRYPEATDAVTLDLLNCIGRGETIDSKERSRLPTDQQYFKSEDDIRAIFPNDSDAIERTVELAGRCAFQFRTGTYYFPATQPPDDDPSESERADTDANWAYFYDAFPPPKDFEVGPVNEQGIPLRPDGAGNIDGYFEWYSKQGLAIRLKEVPEEKHPDYWKRLDFEMKIIEQMGFPAYLLIVAEFINWAKDNDIPVGPGRGSGAGSVVNWAMRITDLDPLRFGLLFERFLNPERVSMPDIDVDFCQDRREEVIEHTRQKYGSDMVSQIITYGKLQAKAALKDVARCCGLEFMSADRIAKLVPNELGIKLSGAMEDERFRSLAEGDPIVGRVVTLARRVEGMTRQTGVHAAGVVIADRPLVEHAPLYRDGPDGGPVVQYEMKAAESVGLIKFDFLGLKTLDQIRDAVQMVERNTGEEIDIDRIPLDDDAPYTLLQKGDGLGVFQVESSGMRDLLKRLRPSGIDDLIALLALYRPGPLSSGMVDNFIDCKHGRRAITYPHPDLEPILESTYGSIVYQEQVMQVAQVLAGYSLGEADLLRRAMGKKKVEAMAAQKIRFVDGAADLGHDRQQADDIFELLAYFAGYGFNKSHSAAYGIVSYQTAWLKANHRAEFMAATMTIEASNTDKLLAYISDCKRAGIKIISPNVNVCVADFDVAKEDRGAIRYGLAAIKGVGRGAVKAIMEAREEAGGQFEDFMDCLERLDWKKVNKKVIESLVKSGAFDWTHIPRRALFETIPKAIATAQKTAEEKNSNQTSLFGMMGSAAPRVRVQIPDLGEWPTAVKLGHERDAIGFFITGHPLEAYRGIVRRVATCGIDYLADQPSDQGVTVAGMVTTFRQVRTKRGDKMGFVTLEDPTGSVECVFFPEPWSRSVAALRSDQPVLVSGKLEAPKDAEGMVKIMAENTELLGDVRERRTRRIDLVFDYEELDAERIHGLRGLLQASTGRCPVYVHVRKAGTAWTSLRLGDELRTVPDESLMQGLESLFRRPNVPRLS